MTPSIDMWGLSGDAYKDWQRQQMVKTWQYISSSANSSSLTGSDPTWYSQWYDVGTGSTGNTTYDITLSQNPIKWTPPPQDLPPRRERPPREFNKYINASDLLEDFIRYLGTQRVDADEVLQLPLDLFVKWLIIQACEADGEEPNVTLELPPPGRQPLRERKQPRCLGCQRFMHMDDVLPMHNNDCAAAYFRRVERAAA